jgi:hypothetical protein
LVQEAEEKRAALEAELERQRQLRHQRDYQARLTRELT